MANDFQGEDHLPALVEYIEHCLTNGAQWCLDAATEAIRSTVNAVNRSKIKILAGGWLRQERQNLDAHSSRARQIERVLKEMSKETSNSVLNREPFKRFVRKRVHYDSRKFPGVYYNARVQQDVEQQIGVNHGYAVRHFNWHPAVWPTASRGNSESGLAAAESHTPGPTPAKRRKQRDMVLETLLANNIEFEFSGGVIIVSAAADVCVRLLGLGINFKVKGGQLLFADQDDDEAACNKSPRGKKRKLESGSSNEPNDPMTVDAKSPIRMASAPPAEPSPLSKAAPVPFADLATVQGHNFPYSQPALSAAKVSIGAAAAGSLRLPPAAEPPRIAAPSQDSPGDSEHKNEADAGARGVLHLAGTDVSSGVMKVPQNPEKQALLKEKVQGFASEVPGGRATPPQAVGPQGAVPSPLHIETGDAHQLAPEPEFRAGNTKVKGPADDADVSNASRAVGVNDNKERGAALNEIMGVVTKVPEGRAAPPHVVEPSVAVPCPLRNENEDDRQPTPADGISAASVEEKGQADNADVSSAAKAAGVHQAKEPEVGPPGLEAETVIGAARCPTPPPGVESDRATLSALDASGPTHPTSDNANVADEGRPGAAAEDDVSGLCTRVANVTGQQPRGSTASSDDTVAESAKEDDAQPEQNETADLPPEPHYDTAPEPDTAEGEAQLALATELLRMETIDLLDALHELSRGVLKSEATKLAVLEAEREKGTLPEDGGSTLEKIVATYKEQTGNPEGKPLFRIIRDWEAARDGLLEARFKALRTEGEAEEEQRAKRGGKETQIGARSAQQSDVRAGGLQTTGTENGKGTGNGTAEHAGRDFVTGTEGEEDDVDGQKENETGSHLSGGAKRATRRGVLTENGQDGTGGVIPSGKEKGAGQARVAQRSIGDAANGAGDPSSQVAPGQGTTGETAHSAPGASRLPMAPHLRAQAPADFDYISECGRGSAVVDPLMQLLSRSRSVSPGRPPRYGDRRRTQSMSAALLENPGYLHSTGLLQEVQPPAQVSCVPAADSTPVTAEPAVLENLIQKGAGCAFAIPAQAPTTPGADQAPMNAATTDISAASQDGRDPDPNKQSHGRRLSDATNSVPRGSGAQDAGDKGVAAALGLLKMSTVIDDKRWITRSG